MWIKTGPRAYFMASNIVICLLLDNNTFIFLTIESILQLAAWSAYSEPVHQMSRRTNYFE
jgi:hypothetical protein